MSHRINTLYVFGTFRLDPSERLLLHEDAPVNLTPKTFDALTLLVERHGKLLSRAEMLQALWPGTNVEENALTKSISEVRKALGAGDFIETVSKTGYRFVAAVTEIPASPESLPVLTDPAPNRSRWIGAAMAVAALAVGAWLLTNTWARPNWGVAGKIETLAVLPFRPMSAQHRDEFLELGIADTLIARLNSTGLVMVRPTNAVRAYTAVDREAVSIGRQLQADAVLDGSLQNLDNKLRVTARLVRVRDGALLWSESLDDTFANLFTVQDLLARRVAGALSLKLTIPQQERLTKRDTGDAEAFEAYQKGRFFAARRTPDGLAKAIEYYQAAIAKDPRYAAAWSGLSDAYMLGAWYDSSPAKPSHLRAREAARRAIELDDSLAEAHTSLALVHENAEWAFADAEKEYRRALDLNPNYSTAHHWYGEFLAFMGRTEDGLAHLRRARQLDTLSLIIGADMAKLFINAHRYDEAIAECKRTLELDPNFAPARGWLADAYSRKGMFREAEVEFAKSQDGRQTASTLLGWATFYTRSGDRAQAAEFCRRFQAEAQREHVPAWMMAQLYLQVQPDRNQAFEWLQRAYDERDFFMATLRVAPEFDGVRTDPRFQQLVERMNFLR